MTREELINKWNSYKGIIIYPTDNVKELINATIKALEQEPCREQDDYENEIEDLHNRLDIAEYDKERLREEVTRLEEKTKALEQEPILDKIRAEIMSEIVWHIAQNQEDCAQMLTSAIEIIDKYKNGGE